MKKFIPTLLLLVICIGGFAYAKSQNFFKEKTPEVQNKLFSEQITSTQRILMEGLGAGTIELAKNDTSWTMKQPIAYPVEKFSAESWLGSLGEIAYTSKIDENATDLAQYGLDKPLFTYTITLKDGTVQKLLVGKALAIAGTSYVKLNDSPVVYEVNDTSLQNLEAIPLDFVDKSSVPFETAKVKSLGVEWKGDKWLMESTEPGKSGLETKWKVSGVEITSMDNINILDKLSSLSTVELPKPAAQTKLDAPELKITVTQTDNGKDDVATYVGKIDKDNVLLAKLGGEWVYVLPIANVQDLFDAGKNPPQPSPSPSPAPAASASPAPAK